MWRLGLERNSGKRHNLMTFMVLLTLCSLASAALAAPAFTSHTPAHGEINAPPASTVTATFTEAMDPATISTGSFAVSHFVGIKAVSAGVYHTVALRNDGTLSAWGRNEAGQTGTPAGLSGVTAIAAGGYHTVALKNDGTVVAWGHNGYDQCTVPSDLTGVSAVAAGLYHTLALKSDGTVVAWGRNSAGQTAVPVGLAGVKAIVAGGDHALALKNDGTVVAWGYNASGQTTVPDELVGVTAVAAGLSHSVALKSGGAVIAWGGNGSGQTAVPAGLVGVTAIAAGGYHTLALKEGAVMAWGESGLGQAAVPAGLAGVTAIGAGLNHSVAAQSDGAVVGWGANDYGQRVTPARLAGVTAISAAVLNSAALKSDGTMVAWGNNIHGQTDVPAGLGDLTAIASGFYHTVALKKDGTMVVWGDDTHAQTSIPAGLPRITAISSAGHHTLALQEDGKVVAWGYNYEGQLDIPAGLAGVSAIAAGYLHSVALKTNGTVVAWGSNGHGECSVPAGLTGVIAIAAGTYYTVALKSDGKVVAWGYDNYGQSTVPPELSGVIAIAAGNLHTVALKNNGTVVAWGYNGNGQTTIPAGLTGVTAIAAGNLHTMALKKDGTVAAWGDNESGQSGVALTGISDSPVAGSLSYHADTRTATFTPSAPLSAGACNVAVAGLRGLPGIVLERERKWSFNVASVPKTGQQVTHAGGDDGALQAGVAWPETRFGDLLDGTVSDGLTGLAWAKDADSPGPVVCGPGTQKSWQGALDHVQCLNQNDYLNYNDWRLANRNELASLADSGQASAAGWLNSQGFTNVRSLWHWSSSTVAGAPDAAWQVDLVSGKVDGAGKAGGSGVIWPVRPGPGGTAAIAPAKTGQTGCWDSAGSPVACAGSGQDGEARAGLVWPAPRFTDHGDRTVSDNLTGSIWSKDGNTPGPSACGPGTPKAWLDALDHVQCLNLNRYLGFNDWRLPNKNELAGLVNSQQGSSADWLNGNGFGNALNQLYWSSSTVAGETGAAWQVHMSSGAVVSDGKSSGFVTVWPVRAGHGAAFGSPVLTVSKSGTGSCGIRSTDADNLIDCGAFCSHAYSYDAPVNLVATAETGSVFAGWSGCDSTDGTLCAVTMSGARNVAATFNLIPPTSAIVRPTTGTDVGGTAINISGTVMDVAGAGVQKVEVSIDGGASWLPAGGTTTWSYLWTLPANGLYTIKSRATGVHGDLEVPGPGVTVAVISWPAFPMRIARLPEVVFTSLQAAFDGTLDGDVIQSQALSFNEDLIFNRALTVTLQGGYDAAYLGNGQLTTINGALRVSDGTVKLEQLRLR